MFSSLRTSPLAQRALGALDMARSFLLLEDDHGVDWEVDRNEPSTPVHPHRAPLRRGSLRRAGMLTAPQQDCISPTFYGRPTVRRSARVKREGDSPARRGSRAGRTETRTARDRHKQLA
jgi:hypothetical protein